VGVNVLPIGQILSKFDLGHMVLTCTSVFYGENPTNSSYFEGKKNSETPKFYEVAEIIEGF
jgi:hypothetical protein